MEFPYIEMKGKLLPIVPVEIKDVELYGFLDSGASYSIFHLDVADILELEVEEGDRIFVTLGDGSFISVYIHKLDVKFANKEFETQIGFSRYLGIGFNIIGRKGFFDNFKICFDERNKMVEVL
ncbi:MAG: hypothetical protein ACE5KE_04765 [Methanosarcinales archaeon]